MHKQPKTYLLGVAMRRKVGEFSEKAPGSEKARNNRVPPPSSFSHLLDTSVASLGRRDPDVSGRGVRLRVHDVRIQNLGDAGVVKLRELPSGRKVGGSKRNAGSPPSRNT